MTEQPIESMSDMSSEDDGNEMTTMYNRVKRSVRKGTLRRTNIIDLVDTIVRRKRVRTEKWQLVRNFCLANFCCCCRKTFILRSNEQRKKQRILTRGFKMLQKYFDISNLMRTVNLTTLMMSAILNKEQRLLLMFQRRMVIEDRPTDHASTSDQSNEDIVQTFHG